MTDTMGSACNVQLVVIQIYVGILKAYLLNHSEKGAQTNVCATPTS